MTGNPSGANDWSAVVIHPTDTVAVALATLAPGLTMIRRAEDVIVAVLIEPIPMGHKFTLADTDVGNSIVKYGEVIGIATAAIPAGAHVHVHNMRSRRARADPGETAA